MHTKSFFLAAAVCATLLGCAPMSTKPPTIAGPCGGSQCPVDLSISDCKISDPGKLDVTKGNRGTVIQWQIDLGSWLAGYKFADQGIVINTADPNREFHDPNRPFGGKTFTIIDNNTLAKEYKYTISVVQGWTGRTCSPLDPIIANQG